MKTVFNTIGLSVVASLLILSSALAQNNQTNNNHSNSRSAVIKVNTVQTAWTESQISRKLMGELAQNGNSDIVNADAFANHLPPFPMDQYSIDSVANWGVETGRRYVVLVNVEHEGLRRKRTFNIPLILQKYENVGEIVGELRVVDVIRRRVVLAEAFRYEKEAKRIVQAAIDDDIQDADLHISAPEKIRFFSDMESEFVKELAAKIRDATTLR